MNNFQKSLLGIIAITLLLPMSQAEDKIYRVEGLPTGDPDYFTEDKFIRHQNIDFSHGEADGDESTQDVLIQECYVRMDLDGDGKAELVKVCVAGDGKELLDVELLEI